MVVVGFATKAATRKVSAVWQTAREVLIPLSPRPLWAYRRVYHRCWNVEWDFHTQECFLVKAQERLLEGTQGVEIKDPSLRSNVSLTKPTKRLPMSLTCLGESLEHRKLILCVVTSYWLCCRILHRYPVITPEPPQWEKDMSMVQDKIAARNREVFSA